jgi:hypothetical protein
LSAGVFFCRTLATSRSLMAMPTGLISLTPGTRIGAYEVTGVLGVGGMGQVYRARDTRLNREVALKILHDTFALDSDWIARFEQEAQAAAALNHPNIVSVYDIGTDAGRAFIVSELLKGESLRETLTRGPIPVRRALALAAQVAHGLTAAHAKGIVHRDLKPENLFVTTDGQVKILDFGVAKLQPFSAPAATTAPTRADTAPGMVVGTIDYMSPEQVRGLSVDTRSDLFSLGAILYEMVSGHRAFDGHTAADTMTAILTRDPEPVHITDQSLAGPVGRVLARCFEKTPDRRFQSAADLAFDLETLATWTSSGVAPAPDKPRSRSAWMRVLMPIAAASIGAFAVGWAVRTPAAASEPRFTQLTFGRGDIEGARFAPDGQTTIYAAAWGADRLAMTIGRADTAQARVIGVDDAALVSVSPQSELAVILAPLRGTVLRITGTLARVSVAGGTPRAVAEGASGADWSPGGDSFVLAKGNRLELSDGKLLYESASWIADPRFSPGGDLVAFADHPTLGDDGDVVIVDMDGHVRAASRGYTTVHGVDWAPSGNEVWFTASMADGPRTLNALALDGTTRLLVRAPMSLFLQDVAADGRVLVTGGLFRAELHGALAGTRETELGAFDWAVEPLLSSDGSTLVFTEGGQPESDYALYLRHAGDPAAVRLATDAWQPSLSPDGRWVSVLSKDTFHLRIVPTGVGAVRELDRGSVQQYIGRANWMPDARRIVFTATVDKQTRSFVQSIDGGAPMPVTEPGTRVLRLSPDGTQAILMKADGSRTLAPLGESAGRLLPFAAGGISGWSSDGRDLFLREGTGWPLSVSRVNLESGLHTPLMSFMPGDMAGVRAPNGAVVSGDGRSYVYAFTRSLSQLYIVSGVR